MHTMQGILVQGVGSQNWKGSREFSDGKEVSYYYSQVGLNSVLSLTRDKIQSLMTSSQIYVIYHSQKYLYIR